MATGTGRANVNVSLSRNWEHLQNKYVGTGHPDTTKHEWIVNHHRDSFASHLGHYDLLSYFAVAENEAVGRVRIDMLEKMIQPCGPPPKRQDVEGDDEHETEEMGTQIPGANGADS